MTEGRVGRLGYFGRSIICSVPWMVLGTVGTMNNQEGLLAFAGLFYLGSFVLHVVFAIQRLHDLDRPGSDYFYLFIPLYNVYLAFVLLFEKGSVGPNRYGADPLAMTGPS